MQRLQFEIDRFALEQPFADLRGVKVPVLDEDGFRVLLDSGPDAAREVATTGEEASE